MAGKRTSGTGRRLLVSVVLTVLLVILVRNWTVQILPSVNPEVVTWPVTTEGLALLTGQPHLLLAPVDGQLEPLVAEGERVRKGTPIARLAHDARAGTWLEERAELVREYERLQGELTDQAQPDALRSAAAYLEQIRNLRLQLAGGRLPQQQELENAAAAFAGWAANRTKLHKTLGQLEQLELRLELLDDLLQRGAPVLFAPVAGTVTFSVDGLEEAMAPQRFLEMGPATFARWLDAAKAVAAVAQPPTRLVRSGSPVAAVMDSWSGLVAVPVPQAVVDAGWIQVGAQPLWELSGRQVRVKILRIATEPDYDPIVIAEITSELPYLITRRTASYRIQWGQVSGYLLPAGAVQSDDENPRVIVVEGGRIRRQPVVVLWEQGDELLVDGLSGNETILRNAALGKLLMWPSQQALRAP